MLELIQFTLVEIDAQSTKIKNTPSILYLSAIESVAAILIGYSVRGTDSAFNFNAKIECTVLAKMDSKKKPLARLLTRNINFSFFYLFNPQGATVCVV